MRNFIILLVLLFSFNLGTSQNLKPYTLAFESSEQLTTVKSKIVQELKQNNIEVLGQYSPANDNNRWIIIFTSSELESSVKKIGGLTGFAAAQRIGIIQEKAKVSVSYTTPDYWGNAYYKKDFDKVSQNFQAFQSNLENAMSNCGSFIGSSFGSEDGMTASELRKYHYMLGMPYFDDTVLIGSFTSFNDAVNHINTALKNGNSKVKMVYKKEFATKELCVYGVALSGETGEGKFVPIIDINDPKHVAFLPYEFLVVGNEVHMLHGRYRIALSFPDLTMRTFTKIMSTPGNIEDLMKSVVQ